MSSTLKDRWTDLKAEVAKLKAEAEVRGSRAKESLAGVIADVEEQAAQATERIDTAAAAGGNEARRSLAHLEESLASATTAVQAAWRELRDKSSS